jgi:hypothetical protein
MLTHHLATEDDLPALERLMALAIGELQRGFLDEAQIAASRAVMGLDTRLVADRTYFLVQEDGLLAGCGGWSRRATLYGGDHSTALRDEALLDPASDAARVVSFSRSARPPRLPKASSASSSWRPCRASPYTAPAAIRRSSAPPRRRSTAWSSRSS